MSIDRRLREGANRIASEVDPDVDHHLGETRRRARRRITLRRAGAGLALAGVIVAAILIGPRVLDALGDLARRQPAGGPTPTIGNQAIAGTYTRTIDAGRAMVRRDHLAGRWSITLGPDGTMVVGAPQGFNGVLTGTLFDFDGNRFRTNLFIQDVCSGLAVGSYRVTAVGRELRFVPLVDPCAGRVAVISGGSWTRAG